MEKNKIKMILNFREMICGAFNFLYHEFQKEILSMSDQYHVTDDVFLVTNHDEIKNLERRCNSHPLLKSIGFSLLVSEGA